MNLAVRIVLSCALLTGWVLVSRVLSGNPGTGVEEMLLFQSAAGFLFAAAIGWVLSGMWEHDEPPPGATPDGSADSAPPTRLALVRSRSFGIGFAVFLLSAGLGALASGFIEQARAKARNQEVRIVAKDHARLVEQLVGRSLTANYALAALLHHGNGAIRDFERIASELLVHYPIISALQLAPGGIIRISVPLTGNEQAIGHNLLQDLERNREARLALETRRLTLAGPFELLQGGWAIVGRLPVFLPDVSGSDSFWGFTTSLIRVENLVSVSRLDDRMNEGGYQYILWRNNPSGDGRTTIAKSQGANLPSTAITERIEVPNGYWFLSLASTKGWDAAGTLTYEGVIILLASLLAGYLAFVLQRQPVKLKRMVAQRTGELAAINAQCEAEIVERRTAERKLIHLNRLHALLSRTNEAIVRVPDRQQLLDEICRIAVDESDFTTALFGRVEAESGRLTPVASAGARGGVLERMCAGLDPQTGNMQALVQRVLRGDSYFLEPGSLGAAGVRSVDGNLRLCALLPIHGGGTNAWLLLALFSEAPTALDEVMRRLLEGIAADVSYALVMIEQARLTGAAEERVRQSEARFRNLVETLDDWVWEVDAQGRYTYASPHVRDILGFAPEEVLGRTPFDLMPPDEAARIGPLFAEIVRERRSFALLENRNLRKDGREVMLETSGRPFFSDDGILLGYRGIDRDVTARNLANEELRKLSRAVRQSANAVMITDLRGAIEYVNPKFCELTGYTAEEVLGQNPRLLKSGEMARESYQAMWAALLAGKEWYGEFHNRKKNGELFWCLESISPLRNDKDEITHFVSTKEDISSRKLAESTIRQLAYYDSLTGLPNRRLFRDRLEQAAATAQRTGAAIAVCHIDIDRLRNVNDSLGHAAGDAVIRATAQRINSALRQGDTLSRLEGDEFAVILPEIRGTEEAARIVQQIVAESRFPFTVGGQSVFVTCSVGLSIYPADTHELDILNRNAGTALHRAKAAGDSYQFFTVDMNVQTLQRVTLENSLRDALRDDQFAIAIQAQIDIPTGRLSGAEVLLRCNHPELKGVSPGVFIPLAEETGLIVPIGEWVLRQACDTIARWRRAGLDPVPLSVNISARQFRDPHFVDLVTGILRETGVPHDSLELELTESMIMEHTGEVIERLRRLAAAGLRIAIDDFGTGYSSLSYLKRMPISVLKIDQSFIRDLGEDREDLAIVTAIVALARSLNLRTIAEGVESAAQLELLRAMGCDCMQGYLHSRPLPEAEFTAMLLNKTAAAIL